MSRFYVIGEKNGRQFVGHMDRFTFNHTLDNVREITKAEYRQLRTQGIPSWGEQETAGKLEASRMARAERRRTRYARA